MTDEKKETWAEVCDRAYARIRSRQVAPSPPTRETLLRLADALERDSARELKSSDPPEFLDGFNRGAHFGTGAARQKLLVLLGEARPPRVDQREMTPSEIEAWLFSE